MSVPEKYFAAWVVLALAVVLGLGQSNWWKFYQLSRRGAAGKAIVLELSPQDHMTASYQYQVAGSNFTSRDQSWDPNPPLQQLVSGQTVTIYYDPEHPERSVLGDPRPMLHNETISIGLAAFFIPSIFLWRWSRWKARWNQRCKPARPKALS